MKYIIFKDNQTGELLPVIFPRNVTHKDVYYRSARPDSAGFFWVHCGMGEGCVVIEDTISETLNLGPNKIRDKEILDNIINFY